MVELADRTRTRTRLIPIILSSFLPLASPIPEGRKGCPPVNSAPGTVDSAGSGWVGVPYDRPSLPLGQVSQVSQVPIDLPIDVRCSIQALPPFSGNRNSEVKSVRCDQRERDRASLV